MAMTEKVPNENAIQAAAVLRTAGMSLLQIVTHSLPAKDAAVVAQAIDSGGADVAIDVLLFAGEAQLNLVNPSGANLVLATIPLPALQRVDDVPGITVQ